jgi:hypothetical protein
MVKNFLICILVGTTAVIAQPLPDSSFAVGSHPYSSIGFNASSVSGIGLSYRRHLQSPSLFQFTGGIVTSGGSTASSFGFEYQYELSRKETFRYYIGLGFGLYHGSTTGTATGLGIGLEVPIVGTTIFESVTGGFDLFYPVVYSGDNSVISLGASIYIFYNF